MNIDGRHSWFLMPLFLTGVICNWWKVEYQQQHMCAVEGSSVVIPCSFSSPGSQRVKRVMWGQEKSQSFISESNSRKFQYIGDTRSNCSLKIHQVERNDAGKYSVRIITNKGKGIRPTNGILTLKVVALHVSDSRRNRSGITKEGDSVNLTCFNPCDGGNSSAFTWFKNGELLHEVPTLYLGNMSNTNSGNYTCSLKTQPGSTSEAVNIDVQYGPRNTSVLIKEVENSSNFTLICSSQANPPVKFYSWFKKDEDNMVVAHRSVLFCGEGGQFFCNAANKHGSQNSSLVNVKSKACLTTLTRDVFIITTAVVLLIVTSVIVITIRLKKKRAWEPKLDCREEVQNTDYVNWLPCDDNQSQEGIQLDERTELIYATVDLINRESNIGQQMDSCMDDQSVIYSTVCRHQLLNPSNTEAS
ncbi:sialic acid-binding Ig-like lectin 14 isoform X1 [Labrus bergylta]|uniref:sialic acid-binding Ig-like lectin 14 isoform X1 n=2 Tax=Labrus bergylta TaxID=56723 RepID=UPI0033142749